MSKTVAYPFDDRARTLCPGLRVDTVLHRTDKAVLLAGTLDGLDVVAKLLIDTDPFWQAKFTAEIDTYRAFEVAPPPVPAPRLLAADPDAGVLVSTRLPGVPAARDRYPTALSPDDVRVMLQAARDLRGWSAPDDLFPAVWDYPHRFGRYRTEHGLLDARDEAALNALAAAAGPMRLAHGDLLPANVLRAPGGVLTGVLDWGVHRPVPTRSRRGVAVDRARATARRPP
ncbi:phosphotransferase [Polymorphospora sp. NPDC050346]|uniref:phosphotransferase n=1 Tax=Polymorphospora sp. NPDC050346 TaxID=3155780 RepID=UPI0033EB758B